MTSSAQWAHATADEFEELYWPYRVDGQEDEITQIHECIDGYSDELTDNK